MHCVGWRCDVQIFSAQINGRKRNETRAGSAAFSRIGLAPSPIFWPSHFYLCVLGEAGCQRDGDQGRLSSSVRVCVCSPMFCFFFLHLGGAVCVARSLSLIFTLLLFPREPADVVCVQTPFVLSPHHTSTLPRHGRESSCVSASV